MMDLTGEVSSGAVDMAKGNLEKMLTLCASPLDPAMDPEKLKELKAIQVHNTSQRGRRTTFD